MKPHRASTVFVLGILSIVLCPFCGPAAWTMGNSDLQEMASGRMDYSGRDLTQAGRICGIVGTIFLLLQIFVVALMALMVAVSN